MLLPLAEWVMQGRARTIGLVVIALLTSPVIWPNSILAAAIIALVVLRTGARNGVVLWLWCLPPAFVLAQFLGSYLPFLLVSSVLVSSLILRASASWSYSLIGISAMGLFVAFALEHLAQPMLTGYVELVERLLTDFREQMSDQPEAQAAIPETVQTAFIAGMLANMLVLSNIISLVLGRAWQAGLYNPGGFRKEFHSLRLGRTELIVAVLLALVLFQQGREFIPWGWIALFPLLVAGIALFHAVAWRKQWGVHWYIVFYILLTIWDLLKAVLMVLAFADSLLDFRKKLPQRNIDEDK